MQYLRHLGVEVVLDDVDARILLGEARVLLVDGQRAQPQVARLDAALASIARASAIGASVEP